MRSAGWMSLAGWGGIWTAAVWKVGASSSHSQPRAVSSPPTVASSPSCPALPQPTLPGPTPASWFPSSLSRWQFLLAHQAPFPLWPQGPAESLELLSGTARVSQAWAGMMWWSCIMPASSVSAASLD